MGIDPDNSTRMYSTCSLQCAAKGEVVRRVLLVVTSLLVLGHGVTAEGQDLVSMCENEADVCVWRPNSGWELRWEAQDGFPVEFLDHTTTSDLAVIREATSSSSGKVSVVARSGEVVLQRQILNGISLSAMVGETGNGGLIVCQSTPFKSYCDTTFKGESIVFPDGCLFPRAVAPRRWSCIMDGTEGVTIMMSNGGMPDGGEWSEYARMPTKGIVNNIVWHGERALILVNYELFGVEEGGVVRVIDEDVNALWSVGKRSMYLKVECPDPEQECEEIFMVVGDEDESTVLMRGRGLMPAVVACEGETGLLVDLWGKSERVLRRFARSADGHWSSSDQWRALRRK